MQPLVTAERFVLAGEPGEDDAARAGGDDVFDDPPRPGLIDRPLAG